MPDKCRVCSSGKKNSDYGGSFHRFPCETKYPSLREKWIKAVPILDFSPSNSTTVCDLHFDDDDFKKERTDSNASRKKERGSLHHRELKDDAVPHIWPGFPEYMSRISPKQRSTTTSVDSRTQKDKDLLRRRIQEERDRDKVGSIAEIKNKLEGSLPENIQKTTDSVGRLSLYALKCEPILSVKFSLTINVDLTVELACCGTIIPAIEVDHIITESKISYASEVTAILSFLNGRIHNPTPENLVNMACVILERCIESGETDDEKESKLRFLIEQLQLLHKIPTRRRYSLTTLANCLTWFKTSPAMYKQLLSSRVITIPCTQHLRRLSGALTVDLDFSESTTAYLKAKISHLNERDRTISIIIDEVKTDQNVEYVGGNFFGEKDGVVTKGLLAIMISSLGGKYCDVVAMLPVVTVKAPDIDELYMKVLEGVTKIGFSTSASGVDGYRTNKKFYKDLCGGKVLQPFIHNPFKPEEKIFLLYDTVHLFKCIYNIFLKRERFKIPAFKQFKEMNPDFRHIKRVYQMEFGKTPKFAHKLNDKNLASMAIERCNVKLADAIFHESTINALEVYSTTYPDFVETAKFLKTIRKWWNIVNVNDVDCGKRKRDLSKNAITLKNFDNAYFLTDFADWLENWQSSSKGTELGLTDDTFATTIHTSRTLPLLADHLLRVKKFEYVLFRNTQSDCLEGRFGHQRQLHGGNHYAGNRQFIEAEKTIRLKSLIKFSNISMLEIKEIFKVDNEAEQKKIKMNAISLLESYEFQFSLGLASQEDKAILFYVSGYIAKSILKVEKCLSCRKLLVKDEENLEIRFENVENDENIDDYKKRFYDVINRGGLCNPSDALFMATVHAQEFFDQIFKVEEVRSSLLKCKKPRAVFTCAFTEKISLCGNTAGLSNVKCDQGHKFMKMLEIASCKIFNIGAKNYVSNINSKVHEAKKKSRKKALTKDDAKLEPVRKILKLQSDKA